MSGEQAPEVAALNDAIVVAMKRSEREPERLTLGSDDIVETLRAAGWQLTRIGDEERLRAALDFRASVVFENGWRGPDLLLGIAAYMDRKDDEQEAATGKLQDRTVQADLRRWAAEIRAALAPQPPSPASQGEER